MNVITKFYSITAGGDFGSREAIYELVEGVLVLRSEGQQDGLVGNGHAADFEGLTLEQANQKIEALNSTGSGHPYDGCHACTWSISIRQLVEGEVLPHLTIDWNEKRSGWYGWIEEECDCLVQALSYEIIRKRNDKFFVEAMHWQQEVKLPFKEFDTVDQAKAWCVKYETNRQEKAMNEEFVVHVAARAELSALG